MAYLQFLLRDYCDAKMSLHFNGSSTGISWKNSRGKWDDTNMYEVWVWPLCSFWLWAGSCMKYILSRLQSVAFLHII